MSTSHGATEMYLDIIQVDVHEFRKGRLCLITTDSAIFKAD